ncbi:hypothetical protein PG985_004536 [Apiospora marii]|uniref:Rhodopsin domain-containing protein n=1 Tax=Apiospora marii TaxID=335849 RepID=A0ABR1SBU2_9PEZI
MDELPPGSHDDIGSPFRSFVIAMLVLTGVVITLRLWSRSLGRKADAHTVGLWWDDWASLLSAMVLIAQLIMSLILIDLGVGRHMWMMSREDQALFLKVFFAIYFVYDLALALSKASALLFLHRALPAPSVPQWFRVAILVLHGANLAWFVGIVLGTIFQCSPVAKNWSPSLSGHCSPISALFLGSALPSVFIDLGILLVPMPVLWRLQINRAKKIALTIIFGLGYCVVIVSMGRLITVLSAGNTVNSDITYEGIASFYWFTAETPISLLSVCLPAMLALGRHLTAAYLEPLASKVSSLVTSSSSGSGTLTSSKTGVFVRIHGSGARPAHDPNSGGESDESPDPNEDAVYNGTELQSRDTVGSEHHMMSFPGAAGSGGRSNESLTSSHKAGYPARVRPGPGDAQYGNYSTLV